MSAAYTASPKTLARVGRARGQLGHASPWEPDRTALVVIDMQHYFIDPGAPGEVPGASGIVPAINRLADGLRRAGGLVVWVSTTAQGARNRWARHHDSVLSAERAALRLASLEPGTPFHALVQELDVRAQDLRIEKIHFSAMLPQSSNLDAALRARAMENLLIAGVATNVCCESTARDAAMHDYRVAMVSDVTATWTEAEQHATLDIFMEFFGDVVSVEEALDRLRVALNARSSLP